MIYLLITYLVLLLLIGGFGAAALYHNFKYASAGDMTRIAAGIYVLVSGVLLVGSLVMILGLDWVDVTLS